MANILGNNFMEGPLGVVRFEFDGLDLGKTLGGAEIEFIEDVFDIMYDQDGTQPGDKVTTGCAWQVTTQLAQQTLERLDKVMKGLTRAGNSAKLGRELYQSAKENKAAVLRVYRVDSEGSEAADAHFVLTFYKAWPQVTGPVAYGPDSQRALPVTFYCFWDDTNEAFGYFGNASSVGLTPAE
jgi:hypothetical protein